MMLGSSESIPVVDGAMVIDKALLESLLTSALESSTIPELDNNAFSSGGGYQQKDNGAASDDDDENWDDIWASIQQQTTKPFNASQSEELHRQVFENEQGYLNQSPAFRKGLTDPTIAAEATAERRSASFRARQAKAMEQLNRQLEEFEPVLMETAQQRRRDQQSQHKNTCSRCRCRLKDRDYDIVPQLWMQRQNLTGLCEVCYTALAKAPPDLWKTKQKPSGPTTATESPSAVSRKGAKVDDRGLVQRQASSNSIIINSAPSTGSNSNNSGAPTSRKTSSSPTVSNPRPSNKLRARNDGGNPWIEVEDPNTGEIFYVNQETNEARRAN